MTVKRGVPDSEVKQFYEDKRQKKKEEECKRMDGS